MRWWETIHWFVGKQASGPALCRPVSVTVLVMSAPVLLEVVEICMPTWSTFFDINLVLKELDL